jgi:hypothetical protein
MMVKTLMMAGLLAAGTAATATPAAAWDLLGERIVRDRMDRDVVVLEGHRQFSQIKICVYRHPVRIYDVDVRFNNGGHQDVEVRARINPGGCTRNIDLKGDDRDIRSINMLYEETSWGRRKTATVRVFGR